MNTWQKKLDFVFLLAGIWLALFASFLPWLYLFLPLLIFGLEYRRSEKKISLLTFGLLTLLLIGYLGFLQLAVIDVFGKVLMALSVSLLAFFVSIRRERLNALMLLIHFSVFLYSFIAFSLYSQLYIPYLWIVLGLALVLTILVFLRLFEEKNAKFALLFSLFVTVATLEIFFILSFWPVSLIAKAGTLAIFFYAVYGILRLFLESELRWGKVASYLIIAILLFVLIFATTKWLPFVE